MAIMKIKFYARNEIMIIQSEMLPLPVVVVVLVAFDDDD